MPTTDGTRRGARAAVRIAAVLLVVVAGGLAGGGQAPGAPGAPAAAPSAPPATPQINLGAYQLCSRNDPIVYPLPAEPIGVLLAGYANASKLKSALRLGYPTAAYAHNEGTDEGLRSGGGLVGTELYNCDLVQVELDNQGQREFPPAVGTFLSFGFMPITATAHLRQVGSQPLTAVVYQDIGGPAGSNGPYTVVATAQMEMVIGDVKVNGKPLDVGPNCHTSEPLSSPGNPIGSDGLVLTGGDNPGDVGPLYDFLAGGALAGTATVPSFTGCVGASGENLDPLLTATVSGADNYVKVVQGPLCDVISRAQFCAQDGTTTPAYPPFLTVTHGGEYTATAPLTLTSQVGRQVTTITCPKSTIAGTMPDSVEVPRTSLGTLTWTDFGSCTDTTGASWTVTSQTTAAVGARYYTAATGVSVLSLGNLSLHLVGPAGCTADVGTPDVGVTFANDGSVLTLVPSVPIGALVFTDKNNCPTLHAGVLWSANYPLSSGMQITIP